RSMGRISASQARRLRVLAGPQAIVRLIHPKPVWLGCETGVSANSDEIPTRLMRHFPNPVAAILTRLFGVSNDFVTRTGHRVGCRKSLRRRPRRDWPVRSYE